MRNDDARWVAAALSGKVDGFRALFERHRGAVERLALSFPELDAEEVEAAIEECFADAFAHLPELKEPARFGPWLLAGVRSRCLVRAGPGARCQPMAPVRPPPDLAADPGPRELKRGLAKAARESLAGSPEAEVGALFYGERIPARELAARLGLTPGQVGLQLERVRARVKMRLLARLLEQRIQGKDDQAFGEEHVTPANLSRLLGAERFSDETALARHLAGACPVCQTALAGAREVDPLDGEVDCALLTPAASRARFLDEDFQRVMRRLKLGSRLHGRFELPLRPAGYSKALPLSLAATLAIAAAIALLLQRVPDQHARQEEPPVAISFSLVHSGGTGEPESGHSGGTYADDRELRLHFWTRSPGFVAVLRATGAGHEVLALPGRLGAGAHELQVSGQPARVSLAGTRGRVRFAVAHSVAPLAEAQLEGLGQALSEGAPDSALPEGVDAAWVELEVVPAGEGGSASLPGAHVPR